MSSIDVYEAFIGIRTNLINLPGYVRRKSNSLMIAFNHVTIFLELSSLRGA